MSTVYEGSCVLEVDGVEIEITKLDVKTVTGRKLVKTMNSSGRARGYSQGIAEYTLSVTAVEPQDGTVIDWDNIKNANLPNIRWITVKNVLLIWVALLPMWENLTR